MADGVLTFNAGSYSLKFALFTCRSGAIEPLFRGQLEDLDEDPRFLVADATGRRAGGGYLPPSHRPRSRLAGTGPLTGTRLVVTAPALPTSRWCRVHP